MRVLLTGATGFIGRNLARRLAQAGHEVIGVARRPPEAIEGVAPQRWHAGDFAAMTGSDWQPLLGGVDVVINAVGIIARPTHGHGFEVLHSEAPRVLFEACLEARVQRVVHLSALGADEQASTAYHLSKREGDQSLLSLRGRGLDGVVLQPSLVFGPDGASAQFFLQLAALPCVVVPAGAGSVQPVHVDDLSEAVLRLVEGAQVAQPVIPIVGPEALALEDYLQRLRRAMGLRAAAVLRIPRRLMDLAAGFGDRLGVALLDRDTWQMLRRGNTAAAGPLARLLGRMPRDAGHFVLAHERPAVRRAARLPAAIGLLRASIAAVWIATAAVSFGLYPVADSLALLARVGVEGGVARIMLHGAAALDLVLGIATLAWPRRALWWVQVGLIVTYTALITWRLPEFWLHPYGPILKNLPMLAALGLLIAWQSTEERR